MPRLEDGELATSASKFKKRRAWITSDEPIQALPSLKEEASTIDASLTSLIETKKGQDQNKSKTRVEHEYNKSQTRVEHDYNKSRTRLEQPKPSIDALLPNNDLKQELDYNKTVTRVEHEYNKSETRVEHDYNKSVTTLDIDSFHAFVVLQRTQINFYDDDVRCMLLGLSDVQRRIFWHVAFECLNRRDLRTGPLEIKSFFEPLDISTAVVRTSLNRLIEKRLLQREKGKLGKNGFAIISMSKATHDVAKEIFAGFNSKRATK